MQRKRNRLYPHTYWLSSSLKDTITVKKLFHLKFWEFKMKLQDVLGIQNETAKLHIIFLRKESESRLVWIKKNLSQALCFYISFKLFNCYGLSFRITPVYDYNNSCVLFNICHANFHLFWSYYVLVRLCYISHNLYALMLRKSKIK